MAIKQFITFLIVVLALLAIGFYFFYSYFFVLDEKKQETKEECVARVNNLEDKKFISESFGAWNKMMERDGSDGYFETAIIPYEYQRMTFFELINKYFSCQYDEAENAKMQQNIYDAAISYADLGQRTGLTSLTSIKDFLSNHSSGSYQFFYNELVFGNWEDNCETKLAVLCQPAGGLLGESGTTQWCQGLCQKLETYKNEENKLIVEFFDQQDKNNFLFYEAVAFWLGGKELADKICDGLKDRKAEYDDCKKMLIRWETRLKDCRETKALLSELICEGQ